MRAIFLPVLFVLLPGLALADYVASPEEEAALRKSIAANPPTAETLRAQPYPGARLEPNCSAAKSAERQNNPMVYCYYTTDTEPQVRAWLAGQGKPQPGTTAFVNGDPLVDDKGYVVNDDVFFIEYYVNREAPAAPAPTAAASPAPASTPEATSTPALEPQPASADDPTEQAIETGKKLKGLLGF